MYIVELWWFNKLVYCIGMQDAQYILLYCSKDVIWAVNHQQELGSKHTHTACLKNYLKWTPWREVSWSTCCNWSVMPFLTMFTCIRQLCSIHTIRPIHATNYLHYYSISISLCFELLSCSRLEPRVFPSTDQHTWLHGEKEGLETVDHFAWALLEIWQIQSDCSCHMWCSVLARPLMKGTVPLGFFCALCSLVWKQKCAFCPSITFSNHLKYWTRQGFIMQPS